MLGGACSFLLTLFFALFMGMQFYAWLFQPNYNEQLNRGYMPRKSNETFEMPTTDFLPAVGVYTMNFSDGYVGFLGAEYWDITWRQSTN